MIFVLVSVMEMLSCPKCLGQTSIDIDFAKNYRSEPAVPDQQGFQPARGRLSVPQHCGMCGRRVSGYVL